MRNRFELWRRTKRGRDRIPERLWAAAAKLCRTQSVNRVARCLRLNYASLQERLGRGDVRRQRPRRNEKTGTPGFVEWAVPLPSPEYVLELDGGGAPNVRVRVRGAAIRDVAALARLLRKVEP